SKVMCRRSLPGSCTTGIMPDSSSAAGTPNLQTVLASLSPRNERAPRSKAWRALLRPPWKQSRSADRQNGTRIKRRLGGFFADLFLFDPRESAISAFIRLLFRTKNHAANSIHRTPLRAEPPGQADAPIAGLRCTGPGSLRFVAS